MYLYKFRFLKSQLYKYRMGGEGGEDEIGYNSTMYKKNTWRVLIG